MSLDGQPQQHVRITFSSFLGATYQVKTSDNLVVWTDLGAQIRGNNSLIEAFDRSAMGNARFYRIEWNAPEPPVLPPLATFCAIGDSITDRSSYSLPAIYQGLGYDQSGWGAILEQYSSRRLQSAARSNAFKTDRDHGYSGITTWMFLDGGGWLPAGLVPINDAIASNPDCFIVHIGTNDIAADTPSVIVARIHAIWDHLLATGKPVIGTDILHRPAAYPGWNTTYRDRVNQVNAALRASWQSKGLASYRPWDDLIDKDSNGFAMNYEFPNDYVHPTMRVGLALGKDLHQILAVSYAGAAPVIPETANPAWITPNPETSGPGNLATSWNSYGMGTEGTDVAFSKTSDTEGDWQRVTVIKPQSYSTRGIYSRQAEAGSTWQVGDRCVATARIRVPEGTNLSGIGLDVQCVGASPAWIQPAEAVNTTNTSPIGSYDTTIISDPFTIPANTTQVWFLMRVVGGTGSFEFRQAGIFRLPP
jgi:lysophospholipase L1-like esterase